MSHTRNNNPTAQLERMRIDKWLWAARFYKTRSVAKDAIEGGKVHHQGVRVKVSKEVHVGMQLTIRQGFDEKTVVINALSTVRGGAPQAQQLYTETEESITKRERYATQKKLANLARPDHKPSKRDRRHIMQFQKDHYNQSAGEYDDE